MSRLALLVFGVFAYACFLASFAAGADFIAGAGFVRGIDRPAALSLPAAIAMDVALLALFGVPHSVMARPGSSAALDESGPRGHGTQHLRAEFQHLPGPAVLAVAALPGRSHRLEVDRRRRRAPALGALAAAGFVLSVATTFLINHFDLFGLRQVWLAVRSLP